MTQRRQARQRERLELLLRPLLMEALVPVAQALERLDSRQRETRELVQALVEMPAPEAATPPETRELLLEVLNSLQPPPLGELSQRLGLPTPPPSSRSSAS